MAIFENFRIFGTFLNTWNEKMKFPFKWYISWVYVDKNLAVRKWRFESLIFELASLVLKSIPNQVCGTPCIFTELFSIGKFSVSGNLESENIESFLIVTQGKARIQQIKV